MSTQAQRRAASRAALLEATARGISRGGYGALKLDDVATAAGYTRGALYHQFKDKDALVLATVAWVRETWEAEVGTVLQDDGLDPVQALTELARRHAVYCRRDVAGVMIVLRVETAGAPIAAAVQDHVADLVQRVRRLILAGRRTGAIGPGPSATVLAGSLLAAIEAATLALRGRTDTADEEVAQRIVRGLLLG
ncbi:TetR/AcrR family transcriptional regulator [Conexibacter woesei]|uniref:TetR/AcrR family transcriptional regulator n=1 Tax=Conexibacter woesei TaxID=191495 RepID=UPI0004256F51|nr:TetR/AcrR family transcriptional regulator [Conexibacter woesei]